MNWWKILCGLFVVGGSAGLIATGADAGSIGGYVTLGVTIAGAIGALFAPAKKE